MKKLLTALLVTAMTFSMVACASNDTGSDNSESSGGDEPKVEATKEEEKPPEVSGNTDELQAEDGAVIKFSYWAGSPSDEDAWNSVLASFKEAHPEITLEAEAYPSENYVTKIDTMVAGNEWPDVMRYTYQKVGKFKEAEVFLDLAPYVSQETMDDLIPAFTSAMTYNGKLVGMPHQTDTMGLFYNKAMFEESGIRIPTSVEDAWTWEEMTEIAEKLKADHGLESVFGGIWENNNAYRYLTFSYMNNGSIFAEDVETISVSEPEFIESIKIYEDWRAKGLASSTGFTQKTACNMAFVAEQLAFVFAGSWQGSFMQENFADRWGVTYMPQQDGKTTGVMGGNGLHVYKETKYPKACAIFINYIIEAEQMKEFCELGSFIPVRQSLVDEGLTYSEFSEEMKIFSQIVSTIDPKMAVDTTSARFQELNIVMSEEMDKLIIEGRSAEDTVAAMEERMIEIMEE